MPLSKYKILGADKLSLEDKVVIYSAASAEDAKFFAEQDGMLVKRVTPFSAVDENKPTGTSHESKDIPTRKLGSTTDKRDVTKDKGHFENDAAQSSTPVNFFVYGARADTGEKVRVKVKATSVMDAEKQAQSKGLFTNRAVPLYEPPPIEKKRHPILGGYLLFMLIVNGFFALGGIATLLAYSQTGGGPIGAQPSIASVWFTIPLSALNLVWVIALYNWKKWGFIGFSIQALLLLPVNIAFAGNPCMSIAGVFGIAVLYVMLQLGKHNKGWEQLD